MGGFSWVVDGPVIKPFPAPCLAGIIVFLPSAFNPTIGSRTILGFLGRRPCFSGNFLFVDGPSPQGLGVQPLSSLLHFTWWQLFSWQPPFLHKGRRMVRALTKKKKKKFKDRVTNLCLRTWASYWRVAKVGSSPSQYQWIVSNVTNFAHVLSSNLVLLKILSKKLHSSRATCGRSRTAKEDS